MTLEHYFRNERRIGEKTKGKLLYFEAMTINRIHNNNYSIIAKTRQMHASNLMHNYISWYAMNHPNSINEYNTSSYHNMRNIVFILKEMDMLESWNGNGWSDRMTKTIKLNNGSVIICHYLTNMNRPDRVLRGKSYGVVVFDEVEVNLGYLQSTLYNIKKLVIISNASYNMFKIWENDEDTYKIFHKIALSIKQNYLMIPTRFPHQYDSWVDQITPFRIMEDKLIKEKNKEKDD